MAKECECCKAEANLTHGFCPDCTKIIGEIPGDRILAIWEARGLQNHLDYTDAEDSIIRRLWDRCVPLGPSCWMDAFFCMLNFTRRSRNIKA